MDIKKYIIEYEIANPAPTFPKSNATDCVERCRYALLQEAQREALNGHVEEIHLRYASLQKKCTLACSITA